MNEEIDVSGCKYAEDSIPVDCNIDTCFCYENNECYYKQLKRLELENKKLKEALEKINSIIDNDFINRYMELSFNEYDDILEKIGKVCDKVCEVLKDE